MTEEQIVDHLARLMTGHVAARCCHITGGLQTQHTHPNCACREYAREVVRLLGPAPSPWFVGGKSGLIEHSTAERIRREAWWAQTVLGTEK